MRNRIEIRIRTRMGMRMRIRMGARMRKWRKRGKKSGGVGGGAKEQEGGDLKLLLVEAALSELVDVLSDLIGGRGLVAEGVDHHQAEEVLGIKVGPGEGLLELLLGLELALVAGEGLLELGEIEELAGRYLKRVRKGRG